ncbi:hypothetical protein [Streptomyces sp. NPDC051992]|jgi:NADPH-dependent 2,4-dienoyl-CoA reductase/sulfur reductase-like enzyme|uniref:hypothetical protein n=1 Tax=Streptomyces sp. NPDC051992 TaxID=3161012 RepID=UPI00341AA347
MADTPPRTGSPATHETDQIVIGGGPADCVAARTAASVGMRAILPTPSPAPMVLAGRRQPQSQ